MRVKAVWLMVVRAGLGDGEICLAVGVDVGHEVSVVLMDRLICC